MLYTRVVQILMAVHLLLTLILCCFDLLRFCHFSVLLTAVSFCIYCSILTHFIVMPKNDSLKASYTHTHKKKHLKKMKAVLKSVYGLYIFVMSKFLTCSEKFFPIIFFNSLQRTILVSI